MFHSRPARRLLATLALLAAATATPAQAREEDHERALRAVRAGQMMPLPEVLDRLARTHPGQVLEVELEERRGAWFYEIRLLQPDGKRVKLEVDARSGDVLRARERQPQQR